MVPSILSDKYMGHQNRSSTLNASCALKVCPFLYYLMKRMVNKSQLKMSQLLAIISLRLSDTYVRGVKFAYWDDGTFN